MAVRYDMALEDICSILLGLIAPYGFKEMGDQVLPCEAKPL